MNNIKMHIQLIQTIRTYYVVYNFTALINYKLKLISIIFSIL